MVVRREAVSKGFVAGGERWVRGGRVWGRGV